VSPVKYELGFYISQDAILHSHRRENLKSYIALTRWTLYRRRNVSPVKYELGFYIPEDAILHLSSHFRVQLAKRRTRVKEAATATLPSVETSQIYLAGLHCLKRPLNWGRFRRKRATSGTNLEGLRHDRRTLCQYFRCLKPDSNQSISECVRWARLRSPATVAGYYYRL
jgi:hypothetical protein